MIMKQKMNLKTLIAGSALLAPIMVSAGSLTINMAANPPASSGFLGGAYFEGVDTHVGGTGVFEPFLTLHQKGVEEGYNYEIDQNKTYFDVQRSKWNTDLKINELQQYNIIQSGKEVAYYVFALDMNDGGQGNTTKSPLSIDNIRIYTSANDTVQAAESSGNAIDTQGELVQLGTLRFALNPILAPTTTGAGKNEVTTYPDHDYVFLQPGNNGSGMFDLYAFIPVSNFQGALGTDYLWFYNMDGIENGADAGFEEWSALKTKGTSTPDAGATLSLLGCALLGIEGMRRKLGLKA